MGTLIALSVRWTQLPDGTAMMLYQKSSVLLVFALLSHAGAATAQEGGEESARTSADEAVETPEKVDVEPVAGDRAIASRLTRILQATGWFGEPHVLVDEGVVFLEGVTASDERREWAGRLAGATQDVVAVVNRITVATPSLLDFSPAYAELEQMGRGAIQSAPTTAVSFGLLVLSVLAARATQSVTRVLAERRVANPLLRGILAKAAAVPVLLLGVYLALRVSGLTRLAATVLGGTGLLGIVIGIAFRDIAENFLASILISVQRPFRSGDLVTIDGRQGFVQAVTTRGTQLMTLDGNHVQIPNSVVYKSVIENATTNPKVRLTFLVGVDYGDSPPQAQQTVLDALRSHPAVLSDPEPLVLVDELATSTVNLRVFFWVDGQRHSVLKVRSAILRRVKARLADNGFTLPDEARELIFPKGVPVEMVGGDVSSTPRVGQDAPQSVSEKQTEEADVVEAEGSLESEKADLQKQAAGSRRPDETPNLLAGDQR